MVVLAAFLMAICCFVLGSMVIIWPDKTRHKLSQASNANIRGCGVIILCVGVDILFTAMIVAKLGAILMALVQ
jgi:hypothetical protein